MASGDRYINSCDSVAPRDGVYHLPVGAVPFREDDVKTAIRQILREAGPSFITGLPPFVGCVGIVFAHYPDMSTDHMLALYSWLLHQKDVADSVDYIYNCLNNATRRFLYDIQQRSIIPIWGYGTKITLAIFVGLLAYLEDNDSSLADLFRDRMNAVNRIAAFNLVVGIFPLGSIGYDTVCDERVDNLHYAFDACPFFSHFARR